MFVSYDSPSMVDVIAKRVRQIVMHGYTSEHDDHHTPAQLLAFGGITWENPTRAQLVSAGACVLAAIDRMDRDDALTMTTNESAPDPTAGERCCPGHGTMAHVRGCENHPEHHHSTTPDADDRLITCPECRSTFEAEDGSLVSTPPADDASTEASEPLTEAERADWPKPGLLGRVKCSDTRWRTAFCVDGPSGLEWVFADNARRRVDTSTAMSLLADPELAAAATKARADAWDEGYEAALADTEARSAPPGPNGPVDPTQNPYDGDA